MENVVICINEILVVPHQSFEEYLDVLDKGFGRLITKGMHVYPKKYLWFKDDAPKNASQVRSFFRNGQLLLLCKAATQYINCTIDRVIEEER